MLTEKTFTQPTNIDEFLLDDLKCTMHPVEMKANLHKLFTCYFLNSEGDTKSEKDKILTTYNSLTQLLDKM